MQWSNAYILRPTHSCMLRAQDLGISIAASINEQHAEPVSYIISQHYRTHAGRWHPGYILVHACCMLPVYVLFSVVRSALIVLSLNCDRPYIIFLLIIARLELHEAEASWSSIHTHIHTPSCVFRIVWWARSDHGMTSPSCLQRN